MLDACATISEPLSPLTDNPLRHDTVPYCTDIILCPQKWITALCSCLVQIKLGVTIFMAKKLMTEMDYQAHTCTTMVGEQ
jgi:hypothetical protein